MLAYRLALTLSILLGLFYPTVSFAQTVINEPSEFIRFNTDTPQKYQFVKRYITALAHIDKIQSLRNQLPKLNFEDPEILTALEIWIKTLADININWRVAKNFLSTVKGTDNGLILKVIKDFSLYCEDIIQLNKEEMILLTQMIQAQVDGVLDQPLWDEILVGHQDLLQRRKSVQTNILSTTFMVNNIMISVETNQNGNFDRLAITDEERRHLMRQLHQFKGESYQGELREGQSFVQGSVALIRSRLEDETWRAF